MLSWTSPLEEISDPQIPQRRSDASRPTKHSGKTQTPLTPLNGHSLNSVRSCAQSEPTRDSDKCAVEESGKVFISFSHEFRQTNSQAAGNRIELSVPNVCPVHLYGDIRGAGNSGVYDRADLDADQIAHRESFDRHLSGQAALAATQLPARRYRRKDQQPWAAEVPGWRPLLSLNQEFREIDILRVNIRHLLMQSRKQAHFEFFFAVGCQQFARFTGR